MPGLFFALRIDVDLEPLLVGFASDSSGDMQALLHVGLLYYIESDPGHPLLPGPVHQVAGQQGYRAARSAFG
jgi:hypothetical protein